VGADEGLAGGEEIRTVGSDTALHMASVGIDETQLTASIRVSGHHRQPRRRRGASASAGGRPAPDAGRRGGSGHPVLSIVIGFTLGAILVRALISSTIRPIQARSSAVSARSAGVWVCRSKTASPGILSP